jgi:polysaccharide export outer membrane protein
MVLLAALLAAMLAACSQSASQQPSGLANPHAAKPELSRIYRLGIGDKLKVTVFGEPELSGQFEVGALGNVSMPLIGEVKAKGQPIHEVKDSIVRKLKDGYLNEPKVSVEVLNYRPFYVHGEVRSGGEFQFKNGVTMRDAVAMAGGYTYRANHNYVLLIREEESQERRVDLPSAVTVLPGDNIRVPERFF